MRNLIRLIVQYHPELLFLVLQLCCLGLLFRYSVMQRTIIFSSASDTIGQIYAWRGNVVSYFDLQEQNRILAAENARLRERVIDSDRQGPVANLWINGPDSSTYELVAAEIINSTYNRRLNYFTLNKGRDHGLETGMGVLASHGIVGVITHVSDHFSVVLPLINRKFTASVEIKDKGYFGLIQWPGRDHRFGAILDIATHARVESGDTVITRGATALFPRGVELGVIEEVERTEGQNYLEARVRFHADFSRLRHVYVLKSTLKVEQEALENRVEVE